MLNWKRTNIENGKTNGSQKLTKKEPHLNNTKTKTTAVAFL